MSVISMAINNLHNVIPEEILEETFKIPYRQDYYSPFSIDDKIRENVIIRRVLPDLNLTYGTTLKIPLARCTVVRHGINDAYYSNYNDYVVTVPPDVTNNRKIVTVLGVSVTDVILYDGNYSGYYWNSGSSILTSAQNMANANSNNTSMLHNAKCEMISPNSFICRYQGYLPPHGFVTFVVEHDENLSDIGITSYDYIISLVELATKAYIYNFLKIKMDKTKLDSGSDLGAFAEFVDSYADANQMYIELREEAWKRSFMNDREGYYDHIRTIIGNVF